MPLKFFFKKKTQHFLRTAEKHSVNKIFLFLAIFFLVPSFLFAGGPFLVDSSGNGAALLWANNNLQWMSDGGGLNSRIKNDVAVRWVSELFDVWRNTALTGLDGEDVPVVDLEVEYLGPIASDITVDNYMSFLNGDDPVAIVVFDEDGSIVDEEFGEGAKNFVVGLASPFGVRNNANFVGGMIVINGIFVDGISDTPELSEEKFKAAILHEIGHLLNLDHTQVNIEATARFASGDVSLSDEIPTMFPVLYTEDQLNPHNDDKIALAELYPSAAYNNEFCRISGNLLDSNDAGFQGADVMARATTPEDEWDDVRAVISGVTYPAGTNDGSFMLGGMLPGRQYRISYLGFPDFFTGGSGVAPFDPPRTGIVATDMGVMACSTAGATVSLGQSIVNYQESAVAAPVDSSSSDDAENEVAGPAAGCSLVR